jgi:preprotein translocase subunit SecY
MQASGALASGVSWSVFMIPATIILAAGSMFILWLGERITDKGVGNGISLIIMIGIIARLPQAFFQEVSSRFTAITGGGLVMFIVEILILYAVVCASILLVQGTRKVPVQYAKRLVGNKQYGGARQYIPLKVVRCQCNAYHLCSGIDVHSFGIVSIHHRIVAGCVHL